MDIDIERLKTDPGYWDEVAPEGADLFVPRSSFEWRKWEGEIEMFYDDGKWLQAISPWSIKTWLEDRPGATPRPTQKPEVEWDGEIPLVGWHGECTWVYMVIVLAVSVVGSFIWI